MKTVDFYVVDVFAKNKYEGNQLAVFVDLANDLSSDQMLNMAKEINFAESTFIKRKVEDNAFEVKIFTAESEIPFAGHPSIGTSYVIAKYLMESPGREVVLKLRDNDINVSIANTNDLDGSLLTMTQSQPAFLLSFSKAAIANQLGIESSLIMDDQPIQEISTGLPFVIVPIKNLVSMRQISLSAQQFKTFLLDNGIYKTNNTSGLSTSLFFYTDETVEAENDYNVRMFCLENEQLIEDAATGSANGCFLAYLLKYVKKEIRAKTEQGFQMNRKSYLYLDGKESEGQYDIKVGGFVKMIAKGIWNV